MTGLVLALVLASAIAHATWNFLLKRSGHQEAFLWLLLASASVLLVPVGATLLWFNTINQPGWWLVLVTIILHVLYFLLLCKGYSQADLSLVYPIARGMGPMLVPILAVLILGERIAPVAIGGIVAIVVGIFVISWWGNWRKTLREPLLMIKNPGTRCRVAVQATAE